MKILVTGSAGFIGFSLSRRLLAEEAYGGGVG
jgi:nucleoside-diphosphate-sugar epimerase